MAIRKFVEVTYNECGNKIVTEKMPSDWIKSVAGKNVHFCCNKCLKKAVSRIDEAYKLAFGSYLNDLDVYRLRKDINKRER
jgi:hypothetical protein